MLYAGTKRLIFALPVGSRRWRTVPGELTYVAGHLCEMRLDGQTTRSADPAGLTMTFYILGDQTGAQDRTWITEISVRHGQTTLVRVVDERPQFVGAGDRPFSRAS